MRQSSADIVLEPVPQPIETLRTWSCPNRSQYPPIVAKRTGQGPSAVQGLALLLPGGDPLAHRQVGNFPQAFSHLALIGTALNLHDVGPAQRREPESPPLATSMRSVLRER